MADAPDAAGPAATVLPASRGVALVNPALARASTSWIPFLAGLLLLLLVGAIAGRLLLANREHNRLVDHTHEVIRTADSLQSALYGATSAQRGLILSGQALFAATAAEQARFAAARRARLVRLTADNPGQQQRLARLVPAVDARLEELAAVNRMIAAGDMAAAANRTLYARLQMDAVRVELDALAAEELRLLAERRERADRSARLALLGTLAGIALAALMVGFSIAALRRQARTLEAANAEIAALAQGLEARVAERTAELEAANEEIQRFAYIVSHDLRSPLVNVMGFTAELAEAQAEAQRLLDAALAAAPAAVTPSARTAIATDMPEAIGFIRAATSRMDRLIKAILTLSREGRRRLAVEPIELSALFAGLAVTQKAALDAAGATLALGPLPAIEGDRLALEQLFGNLLDNAIKYLAPGVPGRIEVTAEEGRDRVAVTVADNGRGIAPADRERVFELFRRAGAQDRPGDGVGLAHVRALTRRLGGSIALTSEIGEGSRFTVTLPRRLAAEEQS
jgi:hypothetical protein